MITSDATELNNKIKQETYSATFSHNCKLLRKLHAINYTFYIKTSNGLTGFGASVYYRWLEFTYRSDKIEAIKIFLCVKTLLLTHQKLFWCITDSKCCNKDL